MGSKKELQAAIAVLGLCMLVFGCTKTAESENSKKQVKIGVAVYNEEDVYVSKICGYLEDEIFQYEKDHPGVEIRKKIADARGSQQEQNDQIDQFISLDYDLLLVNIVDRTNAAVIIDKATQADIPVVFFNREPVREDIFRSDQIYYEGSDAKQSAILQADVIADALEKNRSKIDRNGDGVIQFAMLEGESGHQDTLIRSEWVLKELESPEGFILSDEVIPVTVEEDGQVVEISLANERVYGDLRLTKVDKDYPDNKLTGAEFEVYRDTNGNKELDEGDELLGKLEETSTGIYEMSHILYGGVFVRETKAPEGFLLDENAYYVEITENGKIYEVENEAGIGFTNMAQTGSLRIEKTSSDGKVEGFSFRVTGANGYDQTFKTDKNGEIFIEGLRVGDYTVSEVSDGASANYVLPADKKVTILADKTTVAQMHNELRDTPKTGDDSKPWLWAALMGVSAMGAAALGVAAYVGKRKKGKNTVK